MRYECDDPDFAGDFVEFSDRWSRRQEREVWEALGADEARFLELLRPKIVALRLTCVDAEPIVEAADLTPERTEEIDTRLYGWFVFAYVGHRKRLTDLGNALGRRLFDTFVTAKPTETMVAPTNHLN